MRRAQLGALRRGLRSDLGVGPAEADRILLYVAGRPVFVAEASVRRVLVRHRLLPPRTGYDEARSFVEGHLPSDPVLLKQFHTLLIGVATTFCRATPQCRSCPLRPDLDGKPPAG
jgi:endonuclease-3 related protein